jgi:hypothetical protein
MRNNVNGADLIVGNQRRRYLVSYFHEFLYHYFIIIFNTMSAKLKRDTALAANWWGPKRMSQPMRGLGKRPLHTRRSPSTIFEPKIKFQIALSCMFSCSKISSTYWNRPITTCSSLIVSVLVLNQNSQSASFSKACVKKT